MVDEPAPEKPPPSRAPPPRGERARTLVAAIVVALGAAAFAVSFRTALSFVYRTAFGARDVLESFHGLARPWRIVLPGVGGLVAGTIARLAARVPGGGGVGSVMEAVVLGKTRLSLRRTIAQAAGSFSAIAMGGSIGREGPLIQFGATLGSATARAAGLSSRATRALIAAGASAGFAAAYNTPLAAILFVLEIVTGIVVIDALVPVMIATAIATALTRALVGGGPIYGERGFAIASHAELLAHAALGVVAAVGAQGFMRVLSFGERLFAKLPFGQPWRAALGGVLVGLVAAFLPQVTGNGYEPLNLLLDGRFGLGLIVVLLVAKIFATTASVSSGSPGGVFTPSLFVGGALGMLWGHAVARMTGISGAEGSYALVGMAAASAATTHAPLMAAVLVFELSGDYAIVLPLVLATAIATWGSRTLRRASIYTAELGERGAAWEVTFEGRRI
jgi:CIC family chloride channel protein